MRKLAPTLINFSAAITTWFVSAALFNELMGNVGNWYNILIASLIFVGPAIGFAQFMLVRKLIYSVRDQPDRLGKVTFLIVLYPLCFF